MSAFGTPAAAAQDALQRFANCSPARRALAEESMGGLLIAEGLSGVPLSVSQGFGFTVRRSGAGGVLAGGFMVFFGVIWLVSTSFIFHLRDASTHGQGDGPFVWLFWAGGAALILRGLLIGARGLASVLAGAAMVRHAQADLRTSPPTPADRAGLPEEVTEAWVQTRWPDGRQVEVRPLPGPALRMFGLTGTPIIYPFPTNLPGVLPAGPIGVPPGVYPVPGPSTPCAEADTATPYPVPTAPYPTAAPYPATPTYPGAGTYPVASAPAPAQPLPNPYAVPAAQAPGNAPTAAPPWQAPQQLPSWGTVPSDVPAREWRTFGELMTPPMGAAPVDPAPQTVASEPDGTVSEPAATGETQPLRWDNYESPTT